VYFSTGDYARAEPLYRKASEIDMATRGEKHPNFATDLDNLAELYHEMGDYARAIALCREALDIRKTVLGNQHPEYARSLNGLGVLYRSLGEYGRAEPMFRGASEVYKQTVGERHPQYANCLHNPKPRPAFARRSTSGGKCSVTNTPSMPRTWKPWLTSTTRR
jgi:tetratricopeptide (TPR) repeat protein